MPKKPSVSVGDVFVNTQGCTGIVTKYIGSAEVEVVFTATDNKVSTTAKQLRNGQFKDFYHPRLFGKFYRGTGEFRVDIGGGIKTPEYRCWMNMIQRCYNGKSQTYDIAEVCEGWYNYQNFAKWCTVQVGFNTKDSDGRTFNLDKDLLQENSKLYSPESCCFIPPRLNMLLVGKRTKSRVEPCGVHYDKGLGLYAAQTNAEGKRKRLGNFSSYDEAHQCYLNAKQNLLRLAAEEFKDVISDAAYSRLRNFVCISNTLYK